MESVENADSVAISEKRAISLLDEEKHWLIDRLACYGSITEIARDFHETFGRVIPKSTVSYYDPTSVQGGRVLSQQWKELFAARRKRFLDDVSTIPIANSSYRLMLLNRLIENALLSKRPNTRLIARLMEQAAREVGGSFTNRHVIDGRSELTGAGGGPIMLSTPAMEAAAEELAEWRKRMATFAPNGDLSSLLNAPET